MYCHYDKLRFIYNSIYESLTRDVKVASSQYWKLVLRKLNPNHYVLSDDSCACLSALAYLDGLFSGKGICEPMSLLINDTPYVSTVWRSYVIRTIERFSMCEKRDLLRLLTESPVCGVFVRNQLARE